MATNPKIPPRREPASKREDVLVGGQRNTWWPPVLVICALAVVGALIWWLTGSPNRHVAPTSVTGNGVQLTKLSATTPTVNGAFNVLGTLVNNGSAPITGIKVEAAFKNIHGKTVETIASEVEPAQAVQPPAGAPAGTGEADTKAGANPAQTHGFVTPGGGEGNLTKNPAHANEPTQPGFTNQPVAPGQSAPIAIPFTHVPSGWVGGVPELRIVNVETAANGTEK